MEIKEKKLSKSRINIESLLKNARVCLLLGLVFTVLLSFCRFDAACADLRENVLRLHIRANSDNTADQNLKLKVRDAVLEECDTVFKCCDSLDDAVILAEENIDEINEIAQKAVYDNGFSYDVKAYIGESYFETREYETFTLPAGNYKSLIIEIGEAKGHNWWCVVFPSVCLPAASDASISDSTKEYSAYVASNPKKYVCRFKVVEWYEDLKHKAGK